MRILYGVVGEGMGHAMRSRVVLDHLDPVARRAGGRVGARLRLPGRARQRAPGGAQKIWGYSIVYEDNEVASFRTLLANLKGAVKGWPENVRAYFELADRFQPDVVISDFESWSYLFAKNRDIPVVSVDNIQMLNRCTHAPEILAGHERELRLAKAVVKPKVAGAFHYLITTFFYPPVRKQRTTLHPPILRPEILAAARAPARGPRRRAPAGLPDLDVERRRCREILARAGRECRIYGLRRDLREEVVEGNLRYRPFSEAGFIEDLRTARGVIAGGGFTLMGEAVYLHRPMLAVPVRKQFEQVLNARYLEAEGYGLHADEISDARLGEFLERLPEFQRRLDGYQQDGNRDAARQARRGAGRGARASGDGPTMTIEQAVARAARDGSRASRAPDGARVGGAAGVRCSRRRRPGRGAVCARCSSRPTSSSRRPARSTSTCRWARSAARGPGASSSPTSSSTSASSPTSSSTSTAPTRSRARRPARSRSTTPRPTACGWAPRSASSTGATTTPRARGRWGCRSAPSCRSRSDAHGVGGEALLLIGHAFYRTHLVLNAGAFADPLSRRHQRPPDRRSSSGSTSIRTSTPRGASRSPASCRASASCHRIRRSCWPPPASPSPPPRTSTCRWSVLVGFLEGSDRYGALLGVSPKIHCFH